MKDETAITIAGIFALVLLESVALYLGYDSWLFGVVVIVIAGLSGYKIRDIKLSVRHEEETP